MYTVFSHKWNDMFLWRTFDWVLINQLKNKITNKPLSSVVGFGRVSEGVVQMYGQHHIMQVIWASYLITDKMEASPGMSTYGR